RADNQYFFTEVRMSGQKMDQRSPYQQREQCQHYRIHQRAAAHHKRRYKIKNDGKERPCDPHRLDQAQEKFTPVVHHGVVVKIVKIDRDKTDGGGKGYFIKSVVFAYLVKFAVPSQTQVKRQENSKIDYCYVGNDQADRAWAEF